MRLLAPMLLVVLLSACGDGRAPGEQAFVMSDFAYEPSTITIPADSGTQVLLMTNVGTAPHDFTVTGLPEGTPVHLLLFEDTTEPVPYGLPPLPRGRYPFHCSVDNHADLGMRGVLVVE